MNLKLRWEKKEKEETTLSSEYWLNWSLTRQFCVSISWKTGQGRAVIAKPYSIQDKQTEAVATNWYNLAGENNFLKKQHKFGIWKLLASFPTPSTA